MSDDTTPGPDLWAKLQYLTSDARWGDLLAAQIRDLFEPELDRRDAEIEQLRQRGAALENGVRDFHIKHQLAKERAEQAEAERDRLDVRIDEISRGFIKANRLHPVSEDGNLCTTCKRPYPCPTVTALSSIDDHASEVIAERDQLKAANDRVRKLAEELIATGDVSIGGIWSDHNIEIGGDIRAALDRSDLPAVREFAAKHDPRGEPT